MNLASLIENIIKKIENRPYVWFRFTYSQIGEVKPFWVVWLEGMSGTEATFHDKELHSALTRLSNYLDEVSKTK